MDDVFYSEGFKRYHQKIEHTLKGGSILCVYRSTKISIFINDERLDVTIQELKDKYWDQLKDIDKINIGYLDARFNAEKMHTQE